MRRGQIWVETVIYTLIGLSLMALVLAIVTPKINDYRDRAVIEQTIDSLNKLDSRIREVLEAPGNVRVVEFTMKKGKLYVDPSSDEIYFELEDSKSLYSEPGENIAVGKITVLTTEGVKEHNVRLTLNYTNDILYGGSDSDLGDFSASSTPYNFRISNEGINSGKIRINFESF